MLTLASKLKREDGLKGSRTSATASDSTRRVSVRDRLLVKGNVIHVSWFLYYNKMKSDWRLFGDMKQPVTENIENI